MNLSVKFIYGLVAMINLANKSGQVLLKNIAKDENISEKYLESILGELKKKGLIKTVRGMHGGYSLAKSADQVTILEVFEALEGKAREEGSLKVKHLGIRKMGLEFSAMINQYMSSKKVSDFVGNDAKMYYI